MSATSYPRTAGDWQGVFIRNIAEALAEDCQLSLWAPDGPRPAGVHYACTASDQQWLAQLAARGGIAHLLGKSPIRGLSLSAALLRRLFNAYRRAAAETDLFHVNWLQNALPLKGLRHPAVISVLGTDFKLLRLPGMRSALRAMLRERRAVLAPNAEWMREPLEQAFGDVARVAPVPFGIDECWYALQRKIQQPHRWLAVVRVTRDKIGPLFEWGEALFQDSGRELHLIGPNQEGLALPDWVHFHGPASPGELAQHWFPTATGLVTLSEHSEGRPQVILEALAAGLPVLASDLPAHRDVVESGRTGFLVHSRDAFAEALQAMEDSAAQRDFTVHCRDYAAAHYGTWRDCANRYGQLYESLL
jgi:glycosyltransferase involved in cell wall biosynthesis